MWNKSGFIVFIALLTSLQSHAQLLTPVYSAAYGSPSDPAIIFLHGGPGYNSYSFEATTAERLSREGYHVIVYDQRGSGRSAHMTGTYTFTEALSDMDGLYKKYKIQRATLMGHSWGGAVATMYTEQHPEKVNAVVLVSAPVSYQQTFKSIISHCKAKYTEQNKQDQLQYIAMLEKTDTTDLSYATYCFMHAMAAGLYTAGKPADNAKEISAKMLASPDAKYLRDMKIAPVQGFYKNERYTLLNLTDKLNTIKKQTPVYAIYGNDDGLFDETQLTNIKTLVSDNNYLLVNNASHSVFIDQQDIFINAVKKFTKK